MFSSWFLSVVFLPRDLDLLLISYIGSLVWLNLLLLLPFTILLLRRPLLDLDWSPFLLIVPVLGLVELSTLFRHFSLSLIICSSSALVLSPSKNGCISACLAVSLSFGSMHSKPFWSSRPSLESFPLYFLSKVSGFVTSGNLNPMNLGFLANYSYWTGVSAPRIF